jgi:hypothetical protein
MEEYGRYGWFVIALPTSNPLNGWVPPTICDENLVQTSEGLG